VAQEGIEDDMVRIRKDVLAHDAFRDTMGILFAVIRNMFLVFDAKLEQLS
jgi:hypothetical protein